VTSLHSERLYVTDSAHVPKGTNSSDLAITVELGADAVSHTVSQTGGSAAMRARAMMAELSHG
jgi:hypothetical protein